MPHSPTSAESREERLKKLKENYTRLFAQIGSGKKRTSQYDQSHLVIKGFASSSNSDKNLQEEKKIILTKTFWNDANFRQSTSKGPQMKLSSKLEQLYKKGETEKKQFILDRMDELSLSKPAKIMDFVRKQYPGKNESSGNTFVILGDVHRCIREYLVANGWIEKFCSHDERTELIRALQGLPTGDRTIGKLMATDPVKFIWVNGFINWSALNNNIIVSRIPSCSYYFSKTALNSSIRELLPYLYQKGLIQVQTPRTYEVRAPEDMKHFVKQYRLNACISLMKRFVDSVTIFPSQILNEDGMVPLDSLDFAIQRVVEMIRYHQHDDIDDWHFSVVSDEEWSVFLLRFYDIIHQDAKFQSKNHSMNVQKLSQACAKLCNIYEKYFPGTKHDGHRNLWIVKPSNGSCGRGVKLFKSLKEIQQHCKPTNAYVIQKYIEDPLLIYQTKFDIRQWFLITSVYPLVIWMYDECYLRFCSQQFSLTNVHESVHLCNNSVQYKYKNGARSQRLPEDNMWAEGTFQKYLSERGDSEAWPVIKSKMRQAIIASCLVSQDKMYHRTNSFHLYGADFMLTSDYDVWMIEINTQPSMKYSTKVTTRMCKEVLQDTLKVGLERRSNPLAETGKFVEIYRQQPHIPTAGVPASTAGVSARKIRLLKQTIPSDVSAIKPLEEIYDANSKIVKSVSYGHLATYKKSNKVNFKYLVLGHTDMPLDPGDSISQKDIGYTGELDKSETNDSLPSKENEDDYSGGKDSSEKEKKEVTLEKITQHKKIISKLKHKEKQACDDNKEGNIKTQINDESSNINSYSKSELTENESPFLNKDRETRPKVQIHSELIKKISSITDILKNKTLDKEKKRNSENLETDVKNPKKSEKVESSTKVKRITSSEERKLKVKSWKIGNSINVMNPRDNLVSQKANKSKKIETQANTGNPTKINHVKHRVKPKNITSKENISKIYNTEGKENEVRIKYMKKKASKTSIQMEGKKSIETNKNKSSSKANNKIKKSDSTKVHSSTSSAISKFERQNENSKKKNTLLKMSTNFMSNRVPRFGLTYNNKKKAYKLDLTSDNTKRKKRNSNLSAKKRISVKQERQESNPKDHVETGPNSLIKKDSGEEMPLQQASMSQLMFMMSDSEYSFEIATDTSEKELSFDEESPSLEKPLESEIKYELSGNNQRTKDGQRKQISSIKQYTNRNKYCE